NIFFAQLSGLIAGLVVTTYGLPWIILVVLPLTIPYYLIQVCSYCWRHRSSFNRSICTAFSAESVSSHIARIETSVGGFALADLHTGIAHWRCSLPTLHRRFLPQLDDTIQGLMTIRT